MQLARLSALVHEHEVHLLYDLVRRLRQKLLDCGADLADLELSPAGPHLPAARGLPTSGRIAAEAEARAAEAERARAALEDEVYALHARLQAAEARIPADAAGPRAARPRRDRPGAPPTLPPPAEVPTRSIVSGAGRPHCERWSRSGELRVVAAAARAGQGRRCRPRNPEVAGSRCGGAHPAPGRR